MTWSTAWLWWLAVPGVILGLGAWWRIARGRRPSARFSALPPDSVIPRTWVERLFWLPDALRVLTLVTLVLALGRPRTGQTLADVSADGVDILVAVDTSRSMAALDLDDGPMPARRTRLDVAMALIDRFVAARTSDQVGIVVFGTSAWTHAPLTLDHEAISRSIERVQIGMAGDATALGDALGISVKRLQKSKARSRVVVLVTDGKATAGAVAPIVAAEAAAAVGIKVYTIGVGTQGEAPVLVDGMFGPQVQMIQADLDEATLLAIADQTGGEFFRATDADALAGVFARIDELERSPIESRRVVDWTEHYPWLLAAALLLLTVEVGLRSTRFRSLP